MIRLTHEDVQRRLGEISAQIQTLYVAELEEKL